MVKAPLYALHGFDYMVCALCIVNRITDIGLQSVRLIPIASVITPASLTVETVSASPQFTLNRVPTVDFTSLNFAFMPRWYASRVSAYWIYKGPQYAVSKIATATAAQGNILSFPAPNPNSSWTVDFAGPAIHCGDLDNKTKALVLEQFTSYINQSECLESLGYLAWTPSNDSYHLPMDGPDGESWFANQTVGPLPSEGSSIEHPSVRTPLTLYVAIFPGMKSFVQRYAGGQEKCGTTGVSDQMTNLSILSCELYNASYRTEFTFVNGAQSVTVLNRGLNNHVYGVVTTTDNKKSRSTEYAYNVTIIRRLAYQSVFDAFGQILVGGLYTTLASHGLERNTTSIMSTILSETSELAFLENYGSKMEQGMQESMEWELEHNQGDEGIELTPSIIDSAPRDTRLHMKDSLEGLFQNITISLMTAPLLQ